MNSAKKIVQASMSEQTFCEECGISLGKDSKNGIFQLIILSNLLSNRISHVLAIMAMQALLRHGMISALSVSEIPREKLVKILNENGYARYDEKTATYLQHDAWVILTMFKGDPNNVIKAAQRSAANLKELLETFKGIGSVGAEIFMCEAQIRYKWLYPCTTPKAVRVAKTINMGLEKLKNELSPLQLARLMATLARQRVHSRKFQEYL